MAAGDRPFFDIVGILRQTLNGVYAADGRQLGSFETMAKLCAGQWLVLKGMPSLPPSQLYVKDLVGRLHPLASACWEQGQGVPAFATPAQRAAVEKEKAEKNAPLIPPLSLPDFTGLTIGGDDQPAHRGVNVSQLALFGGLGLAAWLLLRRD